MSTLEDRIRRDLHRAVLDRPKALKALSTGDTEYGDISVLIRDVRFGRSRLVARRRASRSGERPEWND